jgi:hypothetical protein
MTEQTERRRAERRTEEDALSPEYLALLEVCGGEMRASDRELLAQRRQSADAVDPEAMVVENARPSGKAEAPSAERGQPARLRLDRRAAKS